MADKKEMKVKKGVKAFRPVAGVRRLGCSLVRAVVSPPNTTLPAYHSIFDPSGRIGLSNRVSTDQLMVNRMEEILMKQDHLRW